MRRFDEQLPAFQQHPAFVRILGAGPVGQKTKINN